MAGKRTEKAVGCPLRSEAGTGAGMVYVFVDLAALDRPANSVRMTPEAAKRLAVELEAAATAVWSAQRLRRQEAERSACCGD
jgi:hypothetical protein